MQEKIFDFINSKKIIAVIPARGGSKGILKKNIKLLAEKPLISYTIEQAKQSKYISKIYVSTDDVEIEKISKEYGANIIKRPIDISGDNSSSEEALIHATKELKGDYDFMVFLQCTSPIRYPYQIDEAIEKMVKENADSLLTGYVNDRFYWDREGKSLNYDFRARPRRQDKKWEFVENGSFYIFKKEVLLKTRNRLGGKISQYIMPKWMSFEIDEESDFELIKIIMKNKYGDNKTPLDEKVTKIKMILFDLDGVFTDGSVYLDEEGRELLKFSRIDGKGIELLRERGYLIGIISSEENKIVKNRMKKLQIKEINLGTKNKLLIYEQIKEKYNLKDEEICFCGDDIQDLPVIKKCGLSCCPKNAQKDLLDLCNFKSNKRGGEGFVRDVANLFLENGLK